MMAPQESALQGENGTRGLLTQPGILSNIERVGMGWKNMEKRPEAFLKYRWVFMSNMGTLLTITNRFQKTMSQFVGVGSKRVQKGKIWLLSLSQVSWFDRGRARHPRPCLRPASSPSRHNPEPFQVLLQAGIKT